MLEAVQMQIKLGKNHMMGVLQLIREYETGDRQATSLVAVLNALLEEQSRKTDMIQELTATLSATEEKAKRLEKRELESGIRHRNESESDLRIIKEQQESLASMSAQIASLKADLASSKKDVVDAQTKNSNLRKELDEQVKRAERAISELSEAERRILKLKQSAAQDSKKSIDRLYGVDQATTEIMHSYEQKIETLQAQISELRSENKANRYKGSKEDPKVDTVNFDAELAAYKDDPDNILSGTTRLMRQYSDGSQAPVMLDSKKVHQIQSILTEQIQDLESKLVESEKKLQEATEHVDLLKLQMLQTKIPSWVEQAKTESGAALSTRELIRRDKKAWRFKLYQVDAMSLEDCRNLIKSICIRLSIPDVASLMPGLDAIDTTLRLIPQLQGFVTAIDTLVYNYHGRFSADSDVEYDRTNAKRDVPMSKLEDLIEVVGMWARAVVDVGQLKEFWYRIHHVLDVDEKGKNSVGECVEIVRKLQETVIRQNLEGVQQQRRDSVGGQEEESKSLESRIVRHFMDLFEVPNLQQVLPAINELYVTSAERNAGIARLRSSLRKSGSLKDRLDSPGRVMMKAAEVIDTVSAMGGSEAQLNQQGSAVSLLGELEARNQPLSGEGVSVVDSTPRPSMGVMPGREASTSASNFGNEVKGLGGQSVDNIRNSPKQQTESIPFSFSQSKLDERHQSTDFHISLP
ncbi:hypothetical protein HDV05_001367 [Chytridiales sp. JEL 0842]|nr:hypothetical protein HDV05_001367 [Chytridiales sp. JEL 0842]